MEPKKRGRKKREHKRPGNFRLTPECIEAVRHEAVKRGVWPNRVVEEIIRNHFRLQQPA